MAVISMGGLRTAHDVAHVSQANIDGVIVGQALLTAQNTTQAVQDLFGQNDS
jgi:indole-3-glycerol phosphate synthase